MACGTQKTTLYDVLSELRSGHIPRSVSLLGQGLSERSVRTLCDSLREAALKTDIAALESVYLMNNDLHDDSVSVLLDALTTTSIKTLNLNGNNLTAAGAQRLARFVTEQTSLRNVYVLNNALGDAGRELVAAAVQARPDIQAFF